MLINHYLRITALHISITAPTKVFEYILSTQYDHPSLLEGLPYSGSNSDLVRPLALPAHFFYPFAHPARIGLLEEYNLEEAVGLDDRHEETSMFR
jgi:hypothetical protein